MIKAQQRQVSKVLLEGLYDSDSPISKLLGVHKEVLGEIIWQKMLASSNYNWQIFPDDEEEDDDEEEVDDDEEEDGKDAREDEMIFTNAGNQEGEKEKAKVEDKQEEKELKMQEEGVESNRKRKREEEEEEEDGEGKRNAKRFCDWRSWVVNIFTSWFNFGYFVHLYNGLSDVLVRRTT